jgi:hypothetical protein
VLGLERGLVPTVRDLLLVPGRVVDAYLQGALPRYYGPFKYFLVVTALTLLFLPETPFFDRGFSQILARRLDLPPAQTLGWVQDWNVLLYAPFVLLLALAMRGFFRARGLNLAEHLVLALYGWSQMLLLGMLGLLAVTALKAAGVRGAVLLPLLLLAPAYWLWFVARTLQLRSFADWLRGFAALPGAFALFLLLTMATLELVVAVWRPAP